MNKQGVVRGGGEGVCVCVGGGGRSRHRGRALKMMNGSGRPEEATIDENFEIVHSLVMCDRR